MLQEGILYGAGDLCHADALAEIADGTGGVATATQAAQSGHTGVIPTGDQLFLYQLTQLALAHDGVVDTQTGKLDLTRGMGHGDIFHHPVVQGAMILVLQRAQGVGNAFDGILDGMGEVVHGEDAPLGALTVMLYKTNAVQHGVTHVEVAAGQIDLGAQGVLTLGELTGAHTAEQIQALFHRTVAIGANCGTGQVTAIFAELLGSQLADIGQTLLDQFFGILIGLLEVVGTVVETIIPVKAQPTDIFLNGLDILGVFLGRVGVIHTQVAQAAVLFGGAEVDIQSLAVTDVQVAVGLGRKTCVDLFHLAGGKVFIDEVMNKVRRHIGGQFSAHSAFSFSYRVCI